MNNWLAWILVVLMIAALCGCATGQDHKPLRSTSADWSDEKRESMEACAVAVVTVLPVSATQSDLNHAFYKCLVSMGATI